MVTDEVTPATSQRDTTTTATSTTAHGERDAGRIGHYRLGRLLGRGGMCEVYEALDERGGGRVALKVVRAEDPAFAARLAQEGRLLERLSHPGLVRLLDGGVVDGRGYLAMELVPGPTLATFLRHGAIAPARAASLGAQLADALAYVHAQGIVHRDVKPSNILLSPDGRARIGDFGISRLLDASTVTVSGVTLGTVAYMAPEQIEHHAVGPAADVWSLGIVLLECLLGRRIYEGSPAQVVALRLARPVPLPPDLPVPWRLALEGMVDHRPDQRLAAGAVASLVRTEPFAQRWDRDGAAEVDTPDVVTTTGADLTSLARDPATAPVAGDGAAGATEIAPFQPSPVAARRSALGRRRRLLVGAAVLAAAVVLLGLALGLPGAGHGAGAGAHGQATTTTASTTTTVPAGQAALAALLADLDQGQSSGAIDPARAQQITADARRAVADQSAGAGDGAGGALGQAADVLTAGVRDGSVDPDTGTTLEGDLSSLASALGVTSAAPSSGPAPAPAPTRGRGTKPHG